MEAALPMRGHSVFLGFIVKKVLGFGSVDTEKEICRHHLFCFHPCFNYFHEIKLFKITC